MVKQTPVSVGWQTLLVVLPLIWLFAFYRIEKLMMGILILLVGFGISIVSQLILPFPYGFGLALIVTIPLSIYFIRKWSKDWNIKIQKSSSQIIPDETQFWVCPDCGGDTQAKNEKQFCSKCNVYL